NLQQQIPTARFWVTTGEALPDDLCRQFYQRLPQATLFNLYGTSEVYDATWWDTSVEQGHGWHIPMGTPIDNVVLYVLDEHFQPVPVGIAGELYIGGVGLARGYYQRPDLTAERFLPNPFGHASGTRLYRTGDWVRYRADGALEYLGRIDQQVKIGGVRIELAEIETVLRQHPAIAQA